jgi:DNA-binding transcriptional LysR family regulator
LQVKRLEEMIGHRLFVRGKGGVVQLTPQGQYLLGRATELMALNDDVVSSLRAQPTHTEVRLGMPQNYTGLNVAEMLARFAETHPGITVDAVEAPDCALLPLLKAGELDLMLCHNGVAPRRWPSVELWRGRLHWITSERHSQHLIDPLPLSLSPGNCPWRPSWLDECEWRGRRCERQSGAIESCPRLPASPTTMQPCSSDWRSWCRRCPDCRQGSARLVRRMGCPNFQKRGLSC